MCGQHSSSSGKTRNEPKNDVSATCNEERSVDAEDISHLSAYDLLNDRPDVVLCGRRESYPQLYQLRPQLAHLRPLHVPPPMPAWMLVDTRPSAYDPFHIERLSDRLLAFSRRGRADKDIALYDLQTNQIGLTERLRGPNASHGSCWHLAKVKSRRTARPLFASIAGQKICIWMTNDFSSSIPSASPLLFLDFEVYCYCLASAEWKGRSGWLFAGGEDCGRISAFDLERPKSPMKWRFHSDSIAAMDVSPKHHALISGEKGTRRPKIRIWDIRDPHQRRGGGGGVVIVVEEGRIGTIRCVPEMDLVLVLHSDGSLSAFDFRKITANSEPVFAIPKLHRGTNGSFRDFGDIQQMCGAFDHHRRHFVSTWSFGDRGLAVWTLGGKIVSTDKWTGFSLCCSLGKGGDKMSAVVAKESDDERFGVLLRNATAQDKSRIGHQGVIVVTFIASARSFGLFPSFLIIF